MTTAKAHADDVLLVSSLQQAREHRQFEQRQALTPATLHRLYGRRVRTFWIGNHVGLNPNQADLLRHFSEGYGAAIKSLDDWQPEPLSLVEQIAELPERNATAGRDYGRGYAHAVRDVLATIANAQAEAQAS